MAKPRPYIELGAEADCAHFPNPNEFILVGVPEQPAGLRCVDLDFHEAGRLAVDELVETNHDHVICLGYPAEAMGRDLTYVRRFMQSVRERADEHGLRLDVVAPVEAGRAGATVAVDRVAAGDEGLVLAARADGGGPPPMVDLVSPRLLRRDTVMAPTASHGR